VVLFAQRSGQKTKLSSDDKFSQMLV